MTRVRGQPTDLHILCLDQGHCGQSKRATVHWAMARKADLTSPPTCARPPATAHLGAHVARPRPRHLGAPGRHVARPPATAQAVEVSLRGLCLSGGWIFTRKSSAGGVERWEMDVVGKQASRQIHLLKKKHG